MKYTIIFFIAVFTGNIAFSASPISKVGGTKVKKGQIAIESRFGYSADGDSSSADKRFQMREHFDYGLKDWYALRFVAIQDKRNGDSLEHASFRVENRFHLIEKSDYGWDGGIRLIYDHSDGDKTPSEIGVRLMAEIPLAQNWSLRHNTIFEHDVGEDSTDGIALSFRHQVTRKVKTDIDYAENLTVGLSVFNSFGRLNDLSGYSNQDHEIRPTIKSSFKNDTFVEVGYGVGISDASPDQAFAISFGKKF